MNTVFIRVFTSYAKKSPQRGKWPLARGIITNWGTCELELSESFYQGVIGH